MQEIPESKAENLVQLFKMQEHFVLGTVQLGILFEPDTPSDNRACLMAHV